MHGTPKYEFNFNEDPSIGADIVIENLTLNKDQWNYT